MINKTHQLSTGLPELDHLLRGLMPGDNVVWQVERPEDYQAFVEPFAHYAQANERHLIYFRFARHPMLLSEELGASVCFLDPNDGFESFLDQIHRVIEEAGKGAFYVFDCLSDLTSDWYSDQMLANFFTLTCPYLFDLETVAYFSILRNYHSYYASTPIRKTTQLLLDVYRHQNKVYLQPLKVQQRYSPDMHMLHIWEGDTFRPVNGSSIIAEVLTSTRHSAMETAIDRLDVWQRTFLRAEEIQSNLIGSNLSESNYTALFKRLLRMVVSREKPLLALAEKHLTMDDVLAISRRTIGTGLVGGKSVGMLLARAILKKTDARWADLLEVHDSFFIASDVFYTFLVQNGCWWFRKNQRDPNSFLQGAERARQRILMGSFPDYILRQLEDMLAYYGHSPIIVRSSSLLEDNFGNAFAGKYQSVFCVNQGSRYQRLENLLAAIRTVYASSMSEDALAYRARHGLLERDEQMALLVQRVSGTRHDNLFYTQAAGVGFSYNPFRWSEHIDPDAGVLRLVFGMGTRAVDRSDDDYTRIVALNDPMSLPESGRAHGTDYAQQRVDVLDLQGNQMVTLDFDTVYSQKPAIPLGLYASADARRARELREQGIYKAPAPTLNFTRLIQHTTFINDMRAMLDTIHKAYEYPVDIEFTLNFLDEERCKINLVQCRPLQVQGSRKITEIPRHIPPEVTLIETRGPLIGHSRIESVQRIIYVVPEIYSNLAQQQRYEVARLIGRLMALEDYRAPAGTLLIGPGRWGTSSPSLGVPVSFTEICRVLALCEIVAMREDLTPDVSLGTHFFSELVEMDILYMAVFPKDEQNKLHTTLLTDAPNSLLSLLPDETAFTDIVRVVHPQDLPSSMQCILHADTMNQRAVCFFK